MSPPPRSDREEQAVMHMQPRIHLGPSAAPSQIFRGILITPPPTSEPQKNLGSPATKNERQVKTVQKTALIFPLNFLVFPTGH